MIRTTYVGREQVVIYVIYVNPHIIQATFTVLIESSKSFPVQGWEAVLWHNGHGDQEWRELQLEDVTTDAKPVMT